MTMKEGGQKTMNTQHITISTNIVDMLIFKAEGRRKKKKKKKLYRYIPVQGHNSTVHLNFMKKSKSW
jgi:hypothetical protein